VGALLAGSAVAYGGSLLFRREGSPSIVPAIQADTHAHQPSVCAENKTHSLYLWIHLKPEANVKLCAKVAASIQDKVTKVTGATPDAEDEVLAGVGFGPNFYRQITNGRGAPENFSYPHRKGTLGEMPSTGGDIFIHAKSSNYSNLWELAQLIVGAMPTDAVAKAEDVYGWQYKEGRDLSGFIDGTENPAEEEDREHVAVSNKCGGSYCITQRWIHKHNVLAASKDTTLENWVGRTKADSIEQPRKTVSAHVARMVGGTTKPTTKPYELVRHSQPYGTVTGESGLFFIGYAASPENFEYMLDRMVGSHGDGVCDDIMRFSSCVSGNYWYFPSNQQLKLIATS
jgi:Dyp-type peroxidase family